MPKTNFKLKRWFKGLMLKHLPAMITCKEFDSFVSDYIDGGLPPKQHSHFERHLRLCRECREYLHAYQRTMEISRAVFPSIEDKIPCDAPEDLIKAILNARKM